jgi:hypothetical protein
MATSHGLTLLDVIQAVSEVAENDLEIIATVGHLISSGQVRLHHDAIGAMRHLVATVHAAAQGPCGSRKPVATIKPAGWCTCDYATCRSS